MSTSNAKFHAHRAKYSSNSDADRIKEVVDAVYSLAKAVEDLEWKISNIESKIR